MAVRHVNRRSPDSERHPALASLAMDLGLYGRSIKPRGGSGASDLKREDVHAAVGRQPEIEAGTDWKFPEPRVLIAMRRSREDDSRRVAALVRERQAAPQSARGVSYALASTEQAARMLPVARHSAGGDGRMSLSRGGRTVRAQPSVERLRRGPPAPDLVRPPIKSAAAGGGRQHAVVGAGARTRRSSRAFSCSAPRAASPPSSPLITRSECGVDG